MRDISMRLLVLILFLFYIGAVAQTAPVTHGAVTAQENQAATSATADDTQLNESAALFLSHSQSEGLLDHVFMKRLSANLFAAHASSTAFSGCTVHPNSCSPGKVCCICGFNPNCLTAENCYLLCNK